MKYIEFFNVVNEVNGVSKLWLKMLDMLKRMQPDISDEALNVFTIYFSLLDEGNTCIQLNEKALKERWFLRWNDLLKIAEITEQDENLKAVFEADIETGLKSFNLQVMPNLLEENTQEKVLTKPFVVAKVGDENWLFTAKYYEAKKDIEVQAKQFFKNLPSEINDKTETIDEKQLEEELLSILKPKTSGRQFKLNKKQLEAIKRGMKENLIITGGPGTGKTTVICFILWKLLHQEDYQNYSLYMAAPSGKASDRMKESILKNLNSFKDEYKEDSVYKKLERANSFTIHRLLAFNPGLNGFSYNKEHPFDEKSIFIIDEASMIDISLFKSLLNAIPSNARIFILGDENQLPSVQAGAVLGDLLSKNEAGDVSIVKLVESMRFASESEIGVFSTAMQNESKDIEKYFHFENWKEWSEKNQFTAENYSGNSYPMEFIQLEKNQKWEQVKKIVSNWADIFYEPVIKKENLRCNNLEKTVKGEYLEEIYTDSLKARILCAERRGVRGVDTINDYLSEYLEEKLELEVPAGEQYFPGQLLMLTQNQAMYSLNNGDSGVVVKFKDDSILYLMIEKFASGEESTTNEKKGIFSIGKYMFFPLYIIPQESIEVAYAITIHKSQGSGYMNILCFFPDEIGHPLLNRQIIYTAITRTEGRTYVVADPEALKVGVNTLIKRDTKIEL